MQRAETDAFILRNVSALVRVEGLEPPSLTALDPKSSVSTNFTTPASLGIANVGEMN